MLQTPWEWNQSKALRLAVASFLSEPLYRQTLDLKTKMLKVPRLLGSSLAHFIEVIEGLARNRDHDLQGPGPVFSARAASFGL